VQENGEDEIKRPSSSPSPSPSPSPSLSPSHFPPRPLRLHLRLRLRLPLHFRLRLCLPFRLPLSPSRVLNASVCARRRGYMALPAAYGCTYALPCTLGHREPWAPRPGSRLRFALEATLEAAEPSEVCLKRPGSRLGFRAYHTAPQIYSEAMAGLTVRYRHDWSIMEVGPLAIFSRITICKHAYP
jgi:hypothetical protein